MYVQAQTLKRERKKEIVQVRDMICLFLFIQHWMTVCLYSSVDRYPIDAYYELLLSAFLTFKLQNNIFFLCSSPSLLLEQKKSNIKLTDFIFKYWTFRRFIIHQFDICFRCRHLHWLNYTIFIFVYLFEWIETDDDDDDAWRRKASFFSSCSFCMRSSRQTILLSSKFLFFFIEHPRTLVFLFFCVFSSSLRLGMLRRWMNDEINVLSSHFPVSVNSIQSPLSISKRQRRRRVLI